MTNRSIAAATRARVSPSGRAVVWGVLVIGSVVAALARPAFGATPSLSTAKTASATSTCQQAQVTLQVNGVGDPVTQRLPLDVMVVFDRSGSMDDAGGNPKQPITDAKNAAITLINQLNNTTDKAGLTSFSTAATLDQALTSNFAAVTSAINAISVSGNTNIGGGVKTGQQEITTDGRAAPTVHVMVVLTDGVANRTASGTSCATSPTSADACTQDAVNQAATAKAAGTIVFTIGLNLNNLGSATAAVARAELQAMASNSGDYYEAPTSSQLSTIFSQIATVITNVAGSNIVVTDILPTGVQYVAGSATPAPVSQAGQTLTWNLGLLDIGNSTSMTFLVTLNPATPNQLVDVFPDSRINYSDYQGNPASTPFPETHVTVPLCATATATVTSTATVTPTAFATATATATATASNTSVPTTTETRTSTATPTLTVTRTPTVTETGTATPTATATPTVTETQTPSVTVTGTPPATATPSDTVTPTETPTATPTGTDTATPADTATAAATATVTQTPSVTVTGTAPSTATPSDTSTPAGTPTATSTSTASPSSTPSPTPTRTHICALTPVSGCKTPVGFHKRLYISEIRGITWKWRTKDVVPLADLGDPKTTTSYAFCVYANGTPVEELDVPAGHQWKARGSKGYKYSDRSGSYDGVIRFVFRAGGPFELADIVLRARGPNAPLPPLPLDEPVIAQVVNSDGPKCWQSNYSPPAKNGPGTGTFLDKND